MSKRISARITCPACKGHFDVELYRWLWVEDPANRRLVADDRLNLVTCPHCHVGTRQEFAVLCTNVQRKIAIWYEPYPDPAVDDDVRQYAQHFGQNSFYSQALRVRNWDDFKAKLTELEALSHKDKQRPMPKQSLETAATVDAFIKSLPNKHPSWLSHLQSPAFRLVYAALPITAPILFGAWNHRTSFDDWLHSFGSQIAWMFVIVTGTFFGLLTALNARVHKLPSAPSKTARVYLFLAMCWVVMSFLVLLLFDPLEYENLHYMDGRQIAQVIFIVFGLPLLSGIAFFVFKRLVK